MFHLNFRFVLFNAENKLRGGWWIAIFFFVLTAFLVPVLIAADKYGFDVSIYIQAIIILAASVLCQLLLKEPLTQLFGRINISWLKQFAYGCVIGGFLMLVPALFLFIIRAVNFQYNPLGLTFLLTNLALFLVVAAAEELLFRGFIFQRLLKGVNVWPAQVLISSFFLLTHLNNPGMSGSIKILASINIFIASILFGLAYIKTKSLAMPIGIHFMANFMQGAILGFGVSGNSQYGILSPVLNNNQTWLTGGEFGLEASIAGSFTLLVITFIFLKSNAPLKL